MKRTQTILAVPLGIALGLSPLAAQSVPTAANVDPATLARYDVNQNGMLDPDELAAKTADESRTATAAVTSATAPRAAEDEVITLSPFEVNSSDTTGYSASNTLSGTRLNSPLGDISGSLSVVTKQQLQDTAVVDLNDIFLYEVGTEGTGQFTDLTNDGRGDYDNVAGNPTGANRMRGLSQAGISVGGFTASSSIPIDTYNVDAVEIARGPNSNLAGLSDAGGTVNLVTTKANMQRSTTSVTTRVDSYGGFRASLDVNRPIIPNAFAVRFSAVYNETAYIRKPSIDQTNRQQLAITVRPFRSTTINASVERFHEFARRANSITPRDTVSLWKSRGSPTYNPVTRYYTLNGVRSAAPITNLNQLPTGISGIGSSNVRIMAYIDDDAIQFLMRGNAPNNPFVGTSSNLTQVTQSSNVPAGGSLFKVPGSTDKAFYDWTDINLGASGTAIGSAWIANASIDQGIINTPTQRLDFNLAWRQEDQKDYRRQFIGQQDGVGTTVVIDTNEVMLDGSPNPFFLRPFIGGVQPQSFSRPVFTDSYRAQLAYQLDLRREPGLWKWLGMHRMLGYYEFSQNFSVSNGFRYTDTVVDNLAINPAATNRSGNNGARTYPRYYMGNTPGGGIEYANSGPEVSEGQFTMRFLDAVSPAWRDEPVTIQDTFFSLQNLQKRKVNTAGGTIQSYLWNDNLVTTYGKRDDRVYTISALPIPLMANGFYDESYLYNRDNYGTNKKWRSGATENKGAVFRPFRTWEFLQRENRTGVPKFLAEFARGLSLHYNESNSFRPADVAYNLYLEELPNPQGQTKEYGFGLGLFDNRFTLRLTHQETIQKASRASTGVIATRALSIDFDNSGQNQNFDLFTSATEWQIRMNPALAADIPRAQELAAEQIGIPLERINSVQGKSISDASDALSRGWELELQFNPTRYWTLRATGNQQEAIDSNLSVWIQRYVEERLPVWTTIRNPEGNLWWSTADLGGIPENYFRNNVQSRIDIIKAGEGLKKPQTREYTLNLITNFRLAGIAGDNKWLKNMDVGGAVRWASSAAIGYLGAAPNESGDIDKLDRTKPVYDHAEANIDLTFGYRTRVFNDKIGLRVQLNVRNANENGRLKGVAVNPDGTFWQYRIVDPRQFILTTTFDL